MDLVLSHHRPCINRRLLPFFFLVKLRTIQLQGSSTVKRTRTGTFYQNSHLVSLSLEALPHSDIRRAYSAKQTKVFPKFTDNFGVLSGSNGTPEESVLQPEEEVLFLFQCESNLPLSAD